MDEQDKIGKAEETYKRRPHGDRPPLKPRLHDRTPVPTDPLVQPVKITRHQLMQREILPQRLEKLHQPRRDILRHGQVRRKRQPRLEVAQEPRAREGMRERFPVRGVPDAEVAGRDRVDLLGVEFVEIAVFVDEDHALVGYFGERVVADGVVAEVVEDF